MVKKVPTTGKKNTKKKKKHKIFISVHNVQNRAITTKGSTGTGQVQP